MWKDVFWVLCDNVIRSRMQRNGECLRKQNKGGRDRNVEWIFCKIRKERVRKESSNLCQRV